MSWVTVVWSMVASACLTLALVHGMVWWWRREVLANLLLSATAVATTLMAAVELWMMRSQAPEELATAIRWLHVPAWLLVVSLVAFVRVYFQAGRRWLAWTVCGVRTLSLLLNFSFDANLNFVKITAVRRIPFLGEPVSIAEGVPNPWMLVGQLSLLLLVIFVTDAAVTTWRTGHRRQAMVVGGSVILFAVMATVEAILSLWGIVSAPITASLFYMGVVVAMGFELSRDVFHATELARHLHESEARMALAAGAVGLGIWIRDLERHTLWATDEWCALYGFTKSDRLDFDRYLQRLHPEDREPVRRAHAKAIEEGDGYELEHRLVLPDGTMRWIASYGRVEFNDAGKAILTRGVSRDISERKRGEESLRESEGRFRTVADTAPVMIWMSGVDKLCNFFNKSWLDFTGRTLEQEMGNGWTEGVHPDDFPLCLGTYTRCFDARQEFTMQYRLRKHNGEYGWVLDTGVPRLAPDGAFLGYIGSCIDITVQKLAEERFRLVVEASPNAMVMVDSGGHIALVNAQAEHVFGYARTELIGQSVEILIPERSRTGHPGRRHDYFTHPTSRPMGAGRELFGQRKDGSEVPIEIGLNPIRGPEGLFVLASIVDISQRKQAELEAVRQRAELTHLSRVTMLGELSGSLAHELNQPLTAILSNAQAAQRYLAKPVPDLAEVRAILTDIVAQDERAGEVIRRLYLLLKKGEFQRQAFDANEVVLEVLKLVRSDLTNHGVTVRTQLAPDLPPLHGDRVQLQQVLLNLMMNASDAMANNAVEDRHLTVRTLQDGDANVRIEVSDVGRGLPAGGAEQAFERFFTTKPHGLGLGLSVCRTIISAHGGILGAADNAGRGATFHCVLPSNGNPALID